MNLVPGFTWHPVDVGNRAARRKGRGHVAHVAVSGSSLLVPGPLNSRPADWHFYLPKVGPGVQMIDLDLQSWSSMNGNGSTTASEAEGGLGTAAQVNAEPWSPDQFESLARILAYENETEGVPLQVMPNSLSSSRGLAPHRWGIDPWRVSGGEVWSSSRGKICPGDAKIAQLPEIVSRANEIVHGSPTPTPPAPSGSVGFSGGLMAPWALPPGHCLGDIKGPANVHGGDPRYDSDQVRWTIEGAQRCWIAAGLVPNVPASEWRTSGWADGKWDAAYSSPVCRAWFARFRPEQPFHDEVWSDDYAFMRGQTF